MIHTEKPKQLKKRAAKGVFWSMATNWGRQLSNLVIVAVLSRFLDASEFGLVALALTFTEFVRIFIDSSFSSAIIQFQNLEEDHLSTGFWFNLLTSVFFAALGIAGSGLISSFYREPALAPIIMVMSVQIVMLSLVATQMALLKRELRFKTIAMRSFIANGAGGVVGIVMAVAGFGVWSLVGRTIVFELANIAFLWTVSKWRPKFIFSFPHLKQLFNFGINTLGIGFLQYFRENLDNLLIGYFLNASLLGYYSIAFRLIVAFDRVIAGIFRTISLPVFSRLQSEPERLKRAFFDATQMTSILSFAAYTGVLLLSKPIILTLYGEPWLASVPVMRWLAVLGIIKTLFIFNGSMLVSLGKPAWNLAIELVDTLLSSIGIILGVKFGIVGVAIGRSLASAIVTPAPMIIIMRLLNERIKNYLKILTPAIVATALMSAIVLVARSLLPLSNPVLTLGVFSAIGGGSYLGFLYLRERELLLKLIDFALLALPDRLRARLMRKEEA